MTKTQHRLDPSADNFRFQPTPGKSCVLILIKYESYTKMKARKKSRSRLENWDEMTEFLALVSKPEIRWKNSRARLEARDWKKKILVLVSKHEIERKKISISSRSVRPEERNSRSRLGHEIERQIFSIPSRKLKQGSRWTLTRANTITRLTP